MTWSAWQQKFSTRAWLASSPRLAPALLSLLCSFSLQVAPGGAMAEAELAAAVESSQTVAASDVTSDVTSDATIAETGEAASTTGEPAFEPVVAAAQSSPESAETARSASEPPIELGLDPDADEEIVFQEIPSVFSWILIFLKCRRLALQT